MPEEKKEKQLLRAGLHHTMLRTSHYASILEVPKEEWNRLMQDRGIFDWNTLNVLEHSFSGHELPENNWNFDYIIVRDFSDKPVLATFLTCALTKDDMLSDAVISADMEEKRKNNPYLFTSRTLSLGSQVTEGNHLYVDYDSPLWKEAAQILFQKMEDLQRDYNATTLMIRDLPTDDQQMDDFMVENGFFKTSLPENHSVIIGDWCSDEDFLQQLSKRSRRHFKESILRHLHKFNVTIESDSSEETIQEYYRLYLNVKEHSLALNTFALPYSLFANICRNNKWEVIRIELKDEFKQSGKSCAGMVLATKQNSLYSGLIVGLDYEENAAHPVYRRAIYEVIKRAKQLNCQKAGLGFSADIEKKKFGSVTTSSCAYVQVRDHFGMASLQTNSVGKKTVTT